MDNLTPQQRRINMQRIRSSGTKPEERVMQALKKQKIYFAKNVKEIFGKPDIVFRRKKIAIFIDSDFWHVHPQNFKMPKTNTVYWQNKLGRNKKRDLEVNETLLNAGWRVLRFWESEINKDLENCLALILSEYFQ